MTSLSLINNHYFKNQKIFLIKHQKNIVRIHQRKQYAIQKMKQTKLNSMRKKVSKLTPKASIESDLLITQLYGLSYTQVFLFSALRNLVTFHMPCLFIYRQLCSFPYMLSAWLTLYMSFLKTIIQLVLYLS